MIPTTYEELVSQLRDQAYEFQVRSRVFLFLICVFISGGLWVVIYLPIYLNDLDEGTYSKKVTASLTNLKVKQKEKSEILHTIRAKQTSLINNFNARRDSQPIVWEESEVGFSIETVDYSRIDTERQIIYFGVSKDGMAEFFTIDKISGESNLYSFSEAISIAYIDDIIKISESSFLVLGFTDEDKFEIFYFDIDGNKWEKKYSSQYIVDINRASHKNETIAIHIEGEDISDYILVSNDIGKNWREVELVSDEYEF